jgi:putative SOS response-associated peptidase YedK
MFKDAYRRRRCILPVDGFYEWKAIKGQKAKQPFAIAMKDGQPFGIGGLWENWKEPNSGEWVRTFALITTDANELVAQIHDRMLLITKDYIRWLSNEPDPRDWLDGHYEELAAILDDAVGRAAQTAIQRARISVSSPLLDGYDEPEILRSSSQ